MLKEPGPEARRRVMSQAPPRGRRWARRPSVRGHLPLAVVLLLLAASGCAAPSHARAASSAAPANAPPSSPPFHLSDLVAPGGRLYWVAQDGAASDSNPGSQWQPFRTIGRAAALMQPGDAVVIRAGTYRETVQPPRGGADATRRITYAGYPGEEVVISGADVHTDWNQEGHLWWTPWTHSLPLGDPAAAFGNPDWLLALRREQVIEDGRPLRQVAQKTQLTPGTFWVDGTDVAPRRIYVRTREDDSPLLHAMELGRRSVLFAPASGVQWLRVKNLTFRYATNQYHQSPAAVHLGAANGLMEDSVVEWLNMLGISVAGTNHVFRRTIAQDNGQIGWGGSCNGCLIEDSKAFRNNWKENSDNNEAGGTKFTYSNHMVLRRFESAGNLGPGIWFDIDNADNVIEDSRVYGNRTAGIKLELDTNRTIVRNNVVFDTKPSRSPSAAILVQSASDNTIVHNTIVAGEGAALLIASDRRASSRGNVVRDNLIVGASGEAYPGVRAAPGPLRDARPAHRPRRARSIASR